MWKMAYFDEMLYGNLVFKIDLKFFFSKLNWKTLKLFDLEICSNILQPNMRNRMNKIFDMKSSKEKLPTLPIEEQE